MENMSKKMSVVIVGATSMIGTSLVRVLKNASLILVGKDVKKLRSLCDHHDSCVFYENDLSDLESIHDLMEKILSQHTVDAFVLNAAIYPYKAVEDLSLFEWQKTFDVGLTSAFLLTQKMILVFKKQKHGKIIFVSSIAGETIGLTNMSAYASVKAGLNGFMRSVSLELAPYNVNVNSISLGKTYDQSQLNDDEKEKKLRNVPLKRFVNPDDVASMIEFLISSKASSITGQNIIIDCGQSVADDGFNHL